MPASASLAGEGVAGELAALIGVEDFGPAMDVHRVLQRGDAEVASMVFDKRQARTLRVAQSMTATR
jgi:hypothetical protein